MLYAKFQFDYIYILNRVLSLVSELNSEVGESLAQLINEMVDKDYQS